MATVANTCSLERDQEHVIKRDTYYRYKIVANAGEATAYGELYINKDTVDLWSTGPTITITYT